MSWHPPTPAEPVRTGYEIGYDALLSPFVRVRFGIADRKAAAQQAATDAALAQVISGRGTLPRFGPAVGVRPPQKRR